MMERPSERNDSTVIPQCNRSPACHVVGASRHSPTLAYGRRYHPYQLKAAMMDTLLVPHLDRHLCFWKSIKLRALLLGSFWMKQNHSSSGWMRRTCSPMLWCCHRRLISWVSTCLTPRCYYTRQVYGAVLRSCKREGFLVYGWWTCFYIQDHPSYCTYNSLHKTSSDFCGILGCLRDVLFN